MESNNLSFFENFESLQNLLQGAVSLFAAIIILFLLIIGSSFGAIEFVAVTAMIWNIGLYLLFERNGSRTEGIILFAMFAFVLLAYTQDLSAVVEFFLTLVFMIIFVANFVYNVFYDENEGHHGSVWVAPSFEMGQVDKHSSQIFQLRLWRQ